MWPLIVLSLLVPAIAFAQEPPPSDPGIPLEPRLEALEHHVRTLERKLELTERKLELAYEQGSVAKTKGVFFSVGPGRGLSVMSNDGRFAMQLRARAQIRNTVLMTPAGVTNEIMVKALRVLFEGHVLSPDVRYFIQLAFGTGDLEPGNPSPFFDAFVEYTKLRDLNIRFGQFFVPFDRARSIRELALQLVDRQLAVVELSLDRDVGIMFSSNDLGGRNGVVSYAIGIFGGEGKNRFGGQNPGFLYTLRFAVRPFGGFDDDVEGDLLRLPKPRLMLGVAGAFNQNTNRSRSTTGTTFTLGGYDYVHAAADMVFKYFGFSLMTEVLYRQALWNNRTGTDERGLPLTEYARHGWGYFVQAGMMLHRNVEVAARWNQLFALAPTDPALIKLVDEQGKEAGGGLNIYLNGHFFKIQVDYFYVFGNLASEGRHQIRAQLDATF